MSNVVKLLSAFYIILAVSSCKNESLSQDEKNFMAHISSIEDIASKLSDSSHVNISDRQYRVPIIFYSDTCCYFLNPRTELVKAVGAVEIKQSDLILYKAPLIDSTSFHMETHIELFDTLSIYGNSPYVRCSTLEQTNRIYPEVKDIIDWIPMVIHEIVHGYQHLHPNYYQCRINNYWPISMFELLLFPSKYEWLCQSLIEENNFLLLALSANNEDETNSFISAFKMVRKKRKKQMVETFGLDYVHEEEELELVESLARYMEIIAGKILHNPVYSENDDFYSSDVVNSYFFVTGYNLIRLLVSKNVDLDILYNCDSIKPLEDYL